MTEEIKFRCEHCNSPLVADWELRGQHLECLDCDNQVTVPFDSQPRTIQSPGSRKLLFFYLAIFLIVFGTVALYLASRSGTSDSSNGVILAAVAHPEPTPAKEDPKPEKIIWDSTFKPLWVSSLLERQFPKGDDRWTTIGWAHLVQKNIAGGKIVSIDPSDGTFIVSSEYWQQKEPDEKQVALSMFCRLMSLAGFNSYVKIRYRDSLKIIDSEDSTTLSDERWTSNQNPAWARSLLDRPFERKPEALFTPEGWARLCKLHLADGTILSISPSPNVVVLDRAYWSKKSDLQKYTTMGMFCLLLKEAGFGSSIKIRFPGSSKIAGWRDSKQSSIDITK